MNPLCNSNTFLIWIIAVSVIIFNNNVIAEEYCGQEDFAKCAKPLDMLNFNSEFSIGAAKKEELEKICLELKSGIRCIQSYTRRCMDLQQRNDFNKLYHGTSQYIRDLCNKGEFQEEYLKHAVCSEKARPDFEICSKTYRDTMIFIHPSRPSENMSITDNIKTICCSINELVDCLEAASVRICGADAGKFTRESVEKLVVSLRKLYCETYAREPNRCRSDGSSGLNISLNRFILIAAILVSIISIIR